jgi:hypothetical protein
MEIHPIFDFSVPDWKYRAFLTISIPVFYDSAQELDVMVLFYEDGLLKSKARIRFPSERKLVITKEFPEKSLDEAIHIYLSMFNDFPGRVSKPAQHDVIKNTTTKGQDLFDLLSKCPNVEMTCTRIIS